MRLQYSIRFLAIVLTTAAVACAVFGTKRSKAGLPCTGFFYETANTASVFRSFLNESPRPVGKVYLNANLLTDDSIKGLADYRNLKELHILFRPFGWCPAGELPTTNLRCAVTDEALSTICKLKKLEILNLTQTEITDTGLKKLASLPNLRELWIAGTKVRGSGFTAFPRGCPLEVLSLARTSINDVDLANLSHLTNIKTLRCDGAKLTGDGLQYLRPMNNLEDLNYPTSELSFEALYRFFAIKPIGSTRGPMLDAVQTFTTDYYYDESSNDLGLNFKRGKRFAAIRNEVLKRAQSCKPNVASVGLESKDLTDETVELLTKIPTLRELSIYDATDTSLSMLRPIQSLELLCLRSPKVEGELVHYLKQFPKLSQIRVSDGSLTLSNIHQLSQLKTVLCWSSELTDEDVQNIAKLPQLESLAVTNTNLGSTAATALSKCDSLKVLNVQVTGINGAVITKLSGLRQLECLNMDGINDQQILGLSAFPNLKWLETDNSPLTDAALKTLCSSEKLESLTISDCQISKQAEKELKSKLPKLQHLNIHRRTQ